MKDAGTGWMSGEDFKDFQYIESRYDTQDPSLTTIQHFQEPLPP